MELWAPADVSIPPRSPPRTVVSAAGAVDPGASRPSATVVGQLITHPDGGDRPPPGRRSPHPERTRFSIAAATTF